MIGVWPQENDKIGSYSPSQIIDISVRFIEQHPSVDDVGFVFESIVDIVERELVTENDFPKGARAAVAIWPHSPASVYKCIGKVAELLLPINVKEILTGNQPIEHTADLEEIVNLVADKYTEGQCIETAQEIINIPPTQVDSHPDGALVLWLKALGSKERSVLNKLLSEEDLNDSQRECLYHYAVDRKDELGLEFFVIALPRALGITDDPSYLDLVGRTRSEIAELAKSTDDKAELCNSIIPMLPGLSGEHLVTMARLIRELGGKGALERDTQTVSNMDTEALSIVVQEMPDSRILGKALKSRSV